MKKALICPNEPVQNGYRIAQVEPAENIFDVAEPLFWRNCRDDIVSDLFYYDPTNLTIKPIPEPQLKLQPISSGAQTL